MGDGVHKICYIYSIQNCVSESTHDVRLTNVFILYYFTENLTVKSLDFSIRLSIFAEESHRYLCFNNKWSLVGSVSDDVYIKLYNIYFMCAYIAVYIIESTTTHTIITCSIFFFYYLLY